MRTATHTVLLFSTNTLQSRKNLEQQLSLNRVSQGENNVFWQLWQQYEDYLYHRCLSWMSGNPTNAEDALSRVMLKAWDKLKHYEDKITNLKAWLTKLTHNLCVDIHRVNNRSANRVENIDLYANGEESLVFSCEDTPESVMDSGEERIVIRRAVDNLPHRLRETFILHFYQDFSYQEIAKHQDISYDNVCKRISQGKKILREELKGYFLGEDENNTILSVGLPLPDNTVHSGVRKKSRSKNSGIGDGDRLKSGKTKKKNKSKSQSQNK
ncbi:MAG: RNA polymerase sigma factor [Nostocaceae cyanobacterium CSU_2_110]|nr:RNA polymerase sigma factor [Nostocaceae cyanobacterium CSU_2_110]